MAQITFIQTDGQRVTVDDAVGTLMEIATQHGVDGISGNCGGVCACSTCHVYVAPEWLERVGNPSGAEADTLEFCVHRSPNSRLGCQVEVSAVMDGLTVEIAPGE
jgi:ferredoxin, 2Fe-2S